MRSMNEPNPESTLVTTRGDTTLIHEYNDNGDHRLTVIKPDTSVTSSWTSYKSPVRIANYVATTDYYVGILPELFEMVGSEWT